MKVYPNSSLTVIAVPSHPVFKFVESEFWKWIEGTNPAAEYKEKYFGDERIYTKKGAIVQAIEEAINEADEEGKPVDLSSFDYDAVFGD